MDSISSAVAGASAATPGSVQAAASVLVLKKALDMQSSSATQLMASLPQPALATSGTLGTQVNTFA
ncbi:MAG TPA: putative motility protein [Piscinibacter sp.]|nr:putative motility protein [Piscinibacter sp.]HOY35018.1 putative motility protein [Piscinibacter sp.]HPG79500.1 putative motility protein [Piscinibacter sp.]HPM66239.1 putative motility protein [Piscinibacter sp.]